MTKYSNHYNHMFDSLVSVAIIGRPVRDVAIPIHFNDKKKTVIISKFSKAHLKLKFGIVEKDEPEPIDPRQTTIGKMFDRNSRDNNPFEIVD